MPSALPDLVVVEHPAPRPPPEPPPVAVQLEVPADMNDSVRPETPASHWVQIAGVDIHVRFPGAEGDVANLDRAGQDPGSSRLSRSGRQKFNFRVQGDYSVHVRGDEQVITWLQVYEEYIAVDRIRLRSFEQHGRMVEWRREDGDRVSFPGRGVLVFDSQYQTFTGEVKYDDGRVMQWSGHRCRWVGKRHGIGIFSRRQCRHMPAAEAVNIPFPPLNASWATDEVDVVDPRAGVDRVQFANVTEVYQPKTLEKLRAHGVQFAKAIAAARALWTPLQPTDHSQLVPLDIRDPVIKGQLNRPEWLVITQADLQPLARGVLLDCRGVDANGVGVIREVRPGDPISTDLAVERIQQDAVLIGFKDKDGIKRLTVYGVDDLSDKWRHTHQDGTIDTSDWNVTSADHHDNFYRYIGPALDSFADEMQEGWWAPASAYPHYVPSDGNPQNMVVTVKPNGTVKVRRSANFSYPHEKARQHYTRRTGRPAPLAYNTDRAPVDDYDRQARYELATKHCLGQTALALWDAGLHVVIIVSDMEHFFRSFTNSVERQALCATFVGDGFSCGTRGDYGPFCKPVMTGRGGDFIVQLTDYVHAEAAETLAWPTDVQDRVQRRRTALGRHHGRYSKAGMFVDDIFNLIGLDPGRQLSQFSERWFKHDMEDRTGFPSALAKLQCGSAIADWIGFTWNLERPFDGRHRLMDHKVVKYRAQLRWAMHEQREWVPVETVEQINGRLMHSAMVYVEIVMIMGPLYRWQYQHLRTDNQQLRRRDQHVMKSLQTAHDILQRNEWRPIFPPVRRLDIRDPVLGVGLSDARKPGEDGPVDGEAYCVGFWTYWPRIGVLYGIVELTADEAALPIPVLEFLGIVWCFEAIWPDLQAAGATSYRGITDSETCFLKHFNNRSGETPMEVVHRRWDRVTQHHGCEADIDYWCREDNAPADGLTHGRQALEAFHALIEHEGFGDAPRHEVDYSRLSRDTKDVQAAHQYQLRKKQNKQQQNV